MHVAVSSNRVKVPSNDRSREGADAVDDGGGYGRPGFRRPAGLERAQDRAQSDEPSWFEGLAGNARPKSGNRTRTARAPREVLIKVMTSV